VAVFDTVTLVHGYYQDTMYPDNIFLSLPAEYNVSCRQGKNGQKKREFSVSRENANTDLS
jgi:hypothetical protein